MKNYILVLSVHSFRIFMTHYICTGECNGVADQPGTCQAGDCSLSGQPLAECNCGDGSHGAEAA